MNTNTNTRTTFVKDLAVNDLFSLSGEATLMLVTGVGTMGNLTRVSFLPMAGGPERTFTKVNLTSVHVH